MPRKAKITAVPVEQVFTHMVADQREQQGVREDPAVFTHRVADQRELKTDAEQMTDIINEVNITLQSDASPLSIEEESLPDGAQIPEDTDGAKGPKAKAKAKRAPSRCPSVRSLRTPVEKPNVIEPEPEVEVQAELPAEEVKVEAKVECPDCGKMMSQKTLRYSHGPICVSKKQKTRTEDNTQSVSVEWVEHEVQRRLYGRREERATRREAMVAKLVQNAF